VLVTTRALAKRNSRRNTRTSEGDLDSLDNATDLAEKTLMRVRLILILGGRNLPVCSPRSLILYRPKWMMKSSGKPQTPH